jgi:predicted N-acyltransferase
VRDYLRAERAQVEAEIEYLGQRLPFRKTDAPVEQD